MTLTELKTLFRRFIVVVAGGPTDKTRGTGMLAILDALAEEIKAGGGLVTTQLLTDTQQQLQAGQPLLPGVQYLLTGDWNLIGDSDQIVAVHALDPSSFRTNGTLIKQGVSSEVIVDVLAGTARAVDSESLYGTYVVQAADVTSPASVITITVPDALSFGTVGLARPGVTGTGQEILRYMVDYTVSGNKLFLSAGISPALQENDEVDYRYQVGTGGGGGGSGVDPALAFPYATIASGTWDVTGKKHAAAYLSLTANTTIAPTGASDGFVGTLLIVNPQNGPLTCALPAGSYGPKNYQPSFAANERRMLTATYAAGTWYFNSAIYYPQ